MKKILSVVLALTMIATLGLTAFAAGANPITDDTTDKFGETIIKTSLYKDPDTETDPAETYTVKIPAATVIPWGAETTAIEGFDVTAQLLYYNVLKVTVAGKKNADDTTTMKFTTPDLAENVTYELPYTLGGTTAFEGGPVVADDKTDLPLTVAVAEADWAKVPVGEYLDTLTFTAALDDIRA